MRITRRYPAAVALATVIALAGCRASSSASVQHPPAPATTAPVTSHSTGIGTAYLATAANGTYWVKLVSVTGQVQAGNQFEHPLSPGDHFADAVFTVTGSTGTSSDDANLDTAVIGSNGQVYQGGSPVIQVPGYTNFNGGVFNVTPGQSETGAVTFELPHGVTIRTVQWTSQMFGVTRTWTVAK